MRIRTFINWSTTLFLFLLVSTTNGQFPVILNEQNVGFGQCLTDSDCLVYSMANETLEEQNIFCNLATSRCNHGTDVLRPSFVDTCISDIEMIVNAYNSWGGVGGRPDIECDGIVVVKFVTPLALHGLLRIYPDTPSTYTPDINDLMFQTEKFVNHPIKEYLFRGICEVDTNMFINIIYFNNDGCTKQAQVVVRNVNGNDYDFQEAGLINENTGFVVEDSGTFVSQLLNFDRFASIAFDPNAWQDFSFIGAPVGTTHRVPFGQIFDGSGTVIQTRTGPDVILSTGEGIKFPPFPGVGHNTDASPPLLSGTVSLQMGIGYAIVVDNPGPDPILQFLQSECGVIEGRMWFPDYLPMYTTPLNNQPGFITPMYFTLEGINFNTKFVPDILNPEDIIGATGVDLTEHPRINVTEIGTAQTLPAYGSCAALARVTIDYSAFGFGAFSTVTVEMNRVNLNVNPLNLTIVETKGPVVEMVFFDVASPGFYCARANFGSDNVLQSCFQVGRLAATATQVRTEVPDPFAVEPGSTAILGFGTKFITYYHTVVPATMIISSELIPQLRICKTSTNATLAQHLMQFGGDSFELFTEDMAMTYIFNFYTIVNHGRFSEYRLRRSRYHGLDVFAEVLTDAAASVFGESAIIKFQLATMETIPSTVEYQCTKRTQVNLITYPRLRVKLQTDRATCPNERSIMTGSGSGGVPFGFVNEIFLGEFNLDEYQFPASYFFKWYNDDSDDILFAALNGWRFPAPSNVNIRLEAYDAAGSLAVAYGNAMSIIGDDTTRVLFLPQQPLCINNTQATVLQAVVNGVTDGLIFYWQPLDVLARELYNPNLLLFDLPNPDHCPLLETMTRAEVHDLCFDKVVNVTDTMEVMEPIANSTNFTLVNVSVTRNMCEGCSNLPIVYPGADNENMRFVSFDDDSFWEAVAWVDSGFIDPSTNRSIYCRSANSTRVRIPFPPTLRFTELQRFTQTCLGNECHTVKIQTIVDPDFPQFANSVQFDVSPSLGTLPNIFPPKYAIRIGETYDFLLTLTDMQMNDLFCPNTVTYTPIARGPIVQVIQTQRSDCDIPTGSATIYMTYQDPDTPDPPDLRSICFLWVERAQGEPRFFQTFDAFVNSPTSQALPFVPFFAEGNEGRFEDIRAGMHTIMLWERCPAYQDTCSNQCTQMINQQTLAFLPEFQVQSLAFQITQFVIENFEDEGGGIVVDRTGFKEALCYGDSYFMNFTVQDNLNFDDDDLPIGFPPYEVFLFEPFTNEILFRGGPSGIIPNDAYINTVVDGIRILLFEFEVEIETGPDFGIRFSGEYFLTVRSLTSGCIRTFSTFIEMVQPFDVILTAVPSDCAYSPGALILQIGGGFPFPEGNLTSFQFPGPEGHPPSTIIRDPIYITEWKTPFNPNTFVREIRPILNPPGLYEVRVLDRNLCMATASATITSPPEIVVEAITPSGICQTSSQATVDVRVTGGTGAKRLLQNLTFVTSSDLLSFNFIATFNQTVEFHIIDEVGCILPNPISFDVPDPGPVNVSIEAFDSCPGIATGRVVATAPDAVSFRWRVDGNNIQRVSGPELTAIRGGSFVEVIASTIIQCEGLASIVVPARTPIMVSEIRTTLGTLSPPCIDTITLDIMGGLTNSNFTVFLTSNPNNATFIYDGLNTVTAFNVCRTDQYVFFISNPDGMCSTEFVSTDPGFGFGAGQPDGPPGLPPFVDTDAVFGGGIDFIEKSNRNPTRAAGIAVAIIAILFAIIIPISIFLYKRKPADL